MPWPRASWAPVSRPSAGTLHTISGYLALGLMAGLTLWGTAALLQKRDDRLARFHRLAIPIWIVWVGSYITGVYLGIQRVSGGA